MSTASSDLKKQYSRNTLTIATLGCAKNLVDSEVLAGKLSMAGYRKVSHNSNDPAEVVILNTCGFIGDAKEESVDTILELLKARDEGYYGKVIVMGCLSQRYRQELEREIPGLDGIFGVNEQRELIRSLKPDLKKELKGERLLGTPGHYAYLKISEGCDRSCAFCAIPAIRGPQYSVPMESLLEESRRLSDAGVRELILIAQDSTRYGTDLYGKRALPALLEKLARQGNMAWIRLHYAYPLDFPLDVLRVMRDYPQICPYLDIPLQHISPKILRGMKRGVGKGKTLALLDTIRRLLPGAAIRTTLITGFPGEGEKEFRELYEFVESQRFHRLGVFTYSREEGTPAYVLGDTVPEKVKQQRRDTLMELQMSIASAYNRKQLGSVMQVIIDRADGESYSGRTVYDSPEVDQEVNVAAGVQLKPGDLCKVRITTAGEYDLGGILTDEPA